MSTLSPDTDPQMEAIQIEIIRRMPAWRKMQIIGEMNEMVKALAIAGI
jgi:hypothetical protein